MGSSKKSKDKDRERNREEKKKKRHRSRSRSKERERHHKHKHKKEKRSHRREKPSRSRSPLSDISDASTSNGVTSHDIAAAAPPPPRLTAPATYSPPPPPPPTLPRGHKRPAEDHHEDGETWTGGGGKKSRDIGGGWEDSNPRPQAEVSSGNSGQGSESLSVEETNKMRAKLGLKPLQVETTVDVGGKSDEDLIELGPGETRIKEDSNVFIHKPASNLRDKLEVEKLREKIAAQREKRKLKEKMSKIRALADSDSEDDALAWVHKNRKLSKEKQVAEKKAKQLEELDAQFGIGDLVEEEVAKDQRKAYGRNHLSGLKVKHHHSRFSESTTILTLADSNVLDEEEDTLVNVNIVDQERVEKNLERRKEKPEGETDYEAPEMDEYGNMKQGNLLGKYDEELEGPKTSSFRIGRKGRAVIESDEMSALGEKQQRLAKLRKLQSLAQTENQLAQEYMTQDEAVSFRKPKKVRKKKKKKFTADDLVPIDDGEVHHGSRNIRRQPQENTVEDNAEGEDGDRVKSLRQLMEEDDDEEGKDNNAMDVDRTVFDDDAGLNDDFELQEALSRSRKAKLAKQRQPKVEELKEILESNELKMSDKSVSLGDLLSDGSNTNGASTSNNGDDMETDNLMMTLNTTDEFCRTLGDIPTYGLSGNRTEEDQANQLKFMPKPTEEDQGGAAGAWEEVGIEDTKVEISDMQAMPILEEEPDASKGAASALKLAIKKGLLETTSTTKKANGSLHHLRAVNYCIDDKAGDDDRRRGGGDRYSGPTSEFKDKEGYKPKIALQYVDDEGRKLCPKEAFRYLSHKFHGKGSGKNKTEKRMKKWQEEQLMKSMSSSDTPLQTLERQIEKQKSLGVSYLVLSGSKNQEPAPLTEARIRK